MDARTSHHPFGIVGNLDLLIAIGYEQVVFDRVGDTHGLFADVLVLGTLRNASHRFYSLFLNIETIEGDTVFTYCIEIGLTVVEPGEVGDAAQAVDAGGMGIPVQLIQRHKDGFFLATRRHGDDVFAVDLHQDILFADPFQLGGT